MANQIQEVYSNPPYPESLGLGTAQKRPYLGTLHIFPNIDDLPRILHPYMQAHTSEDRARYM